MKVINQADISKQIAHTACSWLQDYVHAVVRDDSAAADKAAQLMTTGIDAPAGIGSRYMIEPPSSVAPVDSDEDSGDEAEDLNPLDRQVGTS